jgi:hypothetical protein
VIPLVSLKDSVWQEASQLGHCRIFPGQNRPYEFSLCSYWTRFSYSLPDEFKPPEYSTH